MLARATAAGKAAFVNYFAGFSPVLRFISEFSPGIRQFFHSPLAQVAAGMRRLPTRLLTARLRFW